MTRRKSGSSSSDLAVALSFVFLIATLALGVIGCDTDPVSEPSPEPADDPVDVDPEEAATVIDVNCADICHSLDPVHAAEKSVGEWRAHLEHHEASNRIELTEEETELIVHYLAVR